MGFRKKKTEETEKKEEEPAPPKVSVFQLLRYASKFDLLLFLIGATVAIVTGMGLPFMSVIMGDISQSFMGATAVLGDGYPENGTKELGTKDEFMKKFTHDVNNNCLQYVYVGAAVLAAAFVQVSCFLVASENLMNRLRREFFRSILRQNIAWFDTNHSGTLATKLFDNLERVKEGTGDKVALLIQFVSQFFAGIIIAFTYDWRLTLIMMSLAPFMIICGGFIAKLMATASSEEAKKYSVAGAIAEEVLTCARTVIAFNGQESECDKYEKALEDGKMTGIKKSIYVGVGLALTFMIIFSSYCLAFWVGTNYVYDGSMDGGTVMTVFFAVMMGSMALGQAGPQFAVIGTALGAAGALYEIIDRQPEIDSYSSEGKRPSPVKGRITVNNLHFTYPSRPDVPILKGVSFVANPGETVALVGSSGCGKSTITQLLLRYYNPLGGSICIDGDEIEQWNIEHLRRTIGVVSQEPILFNTTIEQNIRYGREDVTEAEIIAALHKANAYNFVAGFPDGLKTMVGDRGTQMSGGQKQRIAIARALVRDPKILLLDEATSALDAESESVVQQALDNASKGRTTLVIAHRLSTIQNADRIVAMKNGEVFESGTHDELLAKKGLYHELVNAQVFADVDEKDSSEGASVAAKTRRSSESEQKQLKRTISAKGEEKGESDKKEEDVDRLKRELEEEGAVKANLMKILRYARPEWAFIAIATIAALIQGCVFPAFSLLFTQIIAVFANTDKEQMRKDGHFWAIMFLVLGVVQGITMICQTSFFGIASERLTLRVRSKVFRNILRMDATYFDHPRHSAGKLTTRLATDAPNVKSAIDYRLGSVFNAFVSVGCGIGIAFYFGWQMALLVLAIFPLGGAGQAIQLKYMKGKADQDAKEMEGSGKIAMESIENIRTVQALTLEKSMHSQFSHHLEGPHRTSTRKAVMQGVAYAFGSSIFYFLYAAAFRFGLWLIIKSYMAPIKVLKVLFAIAFTSGSMGFASAYFPEYVKATFAAGLMFNMLEEEPRIDGVSRKGKKNDIHGNITFRGVHFTYPQRADVPILKGLDIQVRQGETLALVGPSGCGKSTVISLLERFYDPLDGTVLVDGEDSREINAHHLRSHIALVSQEPILFDTSIKNNIVYGLNGDFTDEMIFEAARKANIHKFVSELPDGYETRVGDKGTQLSGGQKQRIAIARALIRNPRILLLDEATSALDTESEKLVQEALDAASEGRTCIIIAHRLSTVVNADKIVVVNHGQVVEQGTHAELMEARGAYYALTQKQTIHK